VGQMHEIAPGKMAVTEVTLRPRVVFDPSHAATRMQLDALHHAAHEHCFIANSVKTQINIDPVQS
jgi:organic hydroperoxide reductase OsmC/OhrA